MSTRKIGGDQSYLGLQGDLPDGGKLPGTDDTILASQDNNPMDSVNYVFDLDAPALGAKEGMEVNHIRRRRTNFRQWVLLNGVRASTEYLWFVRQSIKKLTNGIEFVNDVPNDNQIGEGGTSLHWNLS